jgi:hypothetical protein
MTTDLLISKIELLEEQIENIERSGFFTEMEIDRAVVSLRSELELYKMHLSYCDSSVPAVIPTTSIQAFGEAIGFATLGSSCYGISAQECDKAVKYNASISKSDQQNVAPQSSIQSKA